MLLRINPSILFLPLKNLMSFLKVRISRTVCRRETIVVIMRRMGLVTEDVHAAAPAGGSFALEIFLYAPGFFHLGHKLPFQY